MILQIIEEGNGNPFDFEERRKERKGKEGKEKKELVRESSGLYLFVLIRVLFVLFEMIRFKSIKNN